MVSLILTAYINISEFTSKQNVESSGYSTFSTKSNVIILSFDSVQNEVFNQYLYENTEFNSVFNGFTSYTDVTAFGPNTNFSLLSTIAGSYFPSGEDGLTTTEISKNISDKSLLNSMSKVGYKVNVHGVPYCMTVFPDLECTNFSTPLAQNFTDVKFSAHDIFILKILPKSFSWKTMELLSEFVSRPDLEANTIAADKKGHGFGIDKYNFTTLTSDISLTTTPVAKFLHYIHTHQPIRFDEECTYKVDTEQSMASARHEIACMTKQIGTFLNALKAAGIYEKSFIIIASDHGYEENLQEGLEYEGHYVNSGSLWSASRYWPILMMKPFNASRPLQFDAKQAQLIDIMPTLYHKLNLNKKIHQRFDFDGSNLFDRKPLNQRKIIVYTAGKEGMSTVHTDLKNFTTKSIYGNAFTEVVDAMKELTPIRDHYFYHASDLPSQLGKISGTSIVTLSNENTKGFITYGPYVRLESGQYSYSMHFSSSLSPKENAGKFDIRSTKIENKAIKEIVVNGTNNEIVNLQGEFVIPSRTLGYGARHPIEARVFYLGKGDFSVISLEFKKLDD